MHKRFVEVEHQRFTALLIRSLRSKQVLVGEIHAAILHQVLMLDLLRHLRRGLALGDLADELAKLVVVELLVVALVRVLLLLLHLLLLILA